MNTIKLVRKAIIQIAGRGAQMFKTTTTNELFWVVNSISIDQLLSCPSSQVLLNESQKKSGKL
jgi:hypothetical protein